MTTGIMTVINVIVFIERPTVSRKKKAQIHAHLNYKSNSGGLLSGYPLLDEAKYFAELVLPHLPNVSMPKVQNRIPETEPVTPLTTAPLR
jgi:predicted DNA-binding protein with PD1-like motif